MQFQRRAEGHRHPRRRYAGEAEWNRGGGPQTIGLKTPPESWKAAQGRTSTSPEGGNRQFRRQRRRRLDKDRRLSAENCSSRRIAATPRLPRAGNRGQMREVLRPLVMKSEGYRRTETCSYEIQKTQQDVFRQDRAGEKDRHKG